MKQNILAYGGQQAEAVALVLGRIPSLAAHAAVSYTSDAAEGDLLAACTVLLLEEGVPAPAKHVLGKRCRVVTFPALDFYALWPFNCVNPHNKPEPPLFPFGRFPYGDSFVQSCIDRQIPADRIIALYSGPAWDASWPDLDRLFQSESLRLAAKDARCSVRLGSYILKHFRRERLFTAVHSPTDVLFTQLVARLLDAGLPAGPRVSNAEIASVLAGLGTRDLLGALAVPIHPKVAEHFGLVWYDAGDLYNYFDIENLTYEEYFRQMIDSIVLARSVA